MRYFSIDDILKINKHLDAVERALDALDANTYDTNYDTHYRGISAVHSVRNIVRRRMATGRPRRGIVKLNPKTTKRSDLKKKKARRVQNKKAARAQRRK
jgi:hypothetical protein